MGLDLEGGAKGENDNGVTHARIRGSARSKSPLHAVQIRGRHGQPDDANHSTIKASTLRTVLTKPTLKPGCLRNEDCTLSRFCISPSISEVVTASVLIASTVNCS
jgi:hypothetical protein